ncbi:hypothetical protein SAY86_029365 [Trapa natans]|uniref:5' exonuclease Apollo n=1 Tax=Trapa natans TaxID=22666 RepID=A0AAN7M3J7_TRANT|nr:hypothetical protein SAY86_029365 [Trapa natans]
MEKRLISVDRWSDGSQAYFLTHLHADHIQGLSSAWSRGPLFCSRQTAKLLPFKFPNFNISLIRILEVDAWHSLFLTSPSSGTKTAVQVMPIDAHHCPGSVMFLFRGDFGSLLYTGDFRWEAMSEKANKSRIILKSAINGSKLDILYLDNTYCHPSYAFPSRLCAAQQVVNIIVSHPEHDIIIAIDNLGKEELLVHISQTLDIKIWVWPERLQTLHLLGYNDRFTTNTSLTRVRAVPRYSFTVDTLEGLNKLKPTIGIMPSGQTGVLRPNGKNGNMHTSVAAARGNGFESSAVPTITYNRWKWNIRSVERLHQYIYSVPYSDHASHEELQDFLELVQPIKMRGIVSSSSCYIDPLYYFGHIQGVNGSSKMMSQKHEEVENASTFQPESLRHSSYSQRKRLRSPRIRILGSRRSRVNALRRARSGAKIVKDDRLD